MQPVRVGLIGCGSFARGMHVPNILKNAKLTLAATCDVDLQLAAKLAQETGARFATNEVEQLLADREIDAVFIVTRHDTHASLAVQAARAGKHILCEKPMGLNRDQCRQVAQAVRDAGVVYTIGYNRGLSPLVTQARAIMAQHPGKKMLYHRIQAPFPADSWTHDPAVGGGRFVGEGCHIFDLFCQLVDAPPVSVYAAGGTFLDPARVHIPDSANVTIGFADGSVATTLIASDGCVEFPKEATEIYWGGKAIYIDNFTTLSYYGIVDNGEGRIVLKASDKGHRVEIDQFADAVLTGTPPPNGLVAAYRAALISYLVNESLASGQAVRISEQDYQL